MSNQPYYPPPYAPQPYPPGYPPQFPYPTQTSTLAVISLISGILGWLGLFGLGGIVAVITGHMAKSRIRDSFGRITGSGMASFGLVLGYLNLIFSCCGALFALIAFVILPLLGVAVSLPFIDSGY
jgi:hypothetical protein